MKEAGIGTYPVEHRASDGALFVARPISREDHARYAVLFRGRVAQHLNVGHTMKEARDLALDDLGHFRVWQYLEQVNAWVDERQRQRATQRKRAA
jgi:hypothetical protein